MSLDKIEKIKEVAESLKSSGKADAVAPLQGEPDRERFQALMQRETTQVAASTGSTNEAVKPSLMDEVAKANGKVDPASRASEADLIAQVHETVARIDKIKKTLETPELHIKNSVQGKMRKKLQHIDESLKSALSRLDNTEAAAVAAGERGESEKILQPIERFLGMLTQGQKGLKTLAASIEAIGAQNQKTIAPAQLLAIQIKVGIIQHQTEFFASLLNKALESTKTIMNVQV